MVQWARTATSPAASASELLHLLRDGVPRTRAELMTLTGLSRSTIGLRLESLSRAGLIDAVEPAASTGGRRPAQISLVPSARLVLAVDLGASHGSVAVCDLSGRLLVTRHAIIDIAAGPETTLDWLVDVADDALAEIGRSPHDIIAVGVGLPGPVEFSTGLPAKPPIMPGWDRFDVVTRIREHFDAHVLVDNDVNIAALGEREHGWPDIGHLLFVKVATGIGAGIVSDGELHRGAQGTAGDIGHVRVPAGADMPCHCGNTGCLEAIASGPAIARTLRKQGHDVTTSADVVELIGQSNLDAIAAVRQAGRAIGEVLTACVSLFNPSVIAVGGLIAQAGDHLLAGIREVVYARSMPIAVEHLVIAHSRTGASAALYGAAALAITEALSPEGLNGLIAAADHQTTVELEDANAR